MPTARSHASRNVRNLPRVAVAALLGQDQRIYVMGGSGPLVDGSVLVLAPNATTWMTVATLPNMPAGTAAALGSSGQILVFGNFPHALTVVQPIASTSGAPFATILEIATPRRDLAAVTGADGRTYVIGGRDAQGRALSTVEIWGASLTLASSSGAAGSTVLLNGSNLSPNATVHVLENSATGQQIGAGAANASGVLAQPVTITIPAGTPSGTMNLFVVDQTTGAIMVIPFTVQ